ncbi:MAG: hypothetical protein ABFS02_09735 [Pseudomonadota bacterium]
MRIAGSMPAAWEPEKAEKGTLPIYQRWIEQLQKGENPFSPENRATLLDELRTGG